MKAVTFLNQLEHDSIVLAIREAEKKTSGEIRVFVSNKKPKDPMHSAKRRFLALGMDKTRERNGVLIYVAPKARKFAIVGDTAVHSRCGEEFWREVSLEISRHFHDGQFTQGILHGIRRAGVLLEKYFPPQPGDENQLPNEVVHE